MIRAKDANLTKFKNSRVIQSQRAVRDPHPQEMPWACSKEAWALKPLCLLERTTTSQLLSQTSVSRDHEDKVPCRGHCPRQARKNAESALGAMAT